MFDPHELPACPLCLVADRLPPARFPPGRAVLLLSGSRPGEVWGEWFRWPRPLHGDGAFLPEDPEGAAEALAGLLDRLGLPVEPGEPAEVLAPEGLADLLRRVLPPPLRDALAVFDPDALRPSPPPPFWGIALGPVLRAAAPDGRGTTLRAAAAPAAAVPDPEAHDGIPFGRPRKGLPRVHRVDAEGLPGPLRVGEVPGAAADPSSPEILPALLLTAVARLAPPDVAGTVRIARLVVEIPAATAEDPDRREAVRRALAGTRAGTVDGRPVAVEVEEVRLVPRPAGTLFALLLDAAGREAPFETPIGVLDVGPDGTDLVVFRPDGAVEVRVALPPGPAMDRPGAAAAALEALRSALAAAFRDRPALRAVPRWALSGEGAAFPEVRAALAAAGAAAVEIPGDPVLAPAVGAARLAARPPRREGEAATPPPPAATGRKTRRISLYLPEDSPILEALERTRLRERRWGAALEMFLLSRLPELREFLQAFGGREEAGDGG